MCGVPRGWGRCGPVKVCRLCRWHIVREDESPDDLTAPATLPGVF